MYAKPFGLRHEPFSIAPDPRFLFMSERHREALAHLLYGIEGGGGFVLLTGEVGAGKTTVCRCFLEQLPERCNVAYIFNPKLTVPELLETVCTELGVAAPRSDSVKQYVDPLQRFLIDAHAAGRQTLLVIDEAQNLDADVLEQLRLLTNLETRERKLLQIILIGQPELRALLARPELEQLAQRVIARYHLQALSAPETAQYVRHRLAVAGLAGPLPFDAAALARIHQHSGGVPRRINLVADRALLGAYAQGASRADRRIVDKAAHEVFDRDPATTPRSAITAGAAAGVAVLALAAAAAWWWPQRTAAWQPEHVPAAPASAAADAAPADASVALAAPADAASAPAEAIATAPPLPLADRAGFADEGKAWQALALAWQVDLQLGRGADACKALATVGLACFRDGGTLALLRQLDRPALLPLHDPEGWAVLERLEGDRATLRLPGGVAEVALPALARRWRGDFATLWRTPSGYSGDTRVGDVLATWLDEQLRAVQGDSLPADSTLRERIEAFQLTHGLKSDGLIGPLTLMQLGHAAGASEPRLNKED